MEALGIRALALGSKGGRWRPAGCREKVCVRYFFVIPSAAKDLRVGDSVCGLDLAVFVVIDRRGVFRSAWLDPYCGTLKRDPSLRSG